jgi:hypothetical protein
MTSYLSSNLDNIRLVGIMLTLNHNYKNACNYEIHIINFIPLNTRWAKVNLEKAGLKFNTPQIKKSIFKKEKW